MKVKDLLVVLNDIEDKEIPVVLSRDEEGNGFSYLSACEFYMFNDESNEIGLIELTEELIKKQYTEEDVMENGVKSLVLWP